MPLRPMRWRSEEGVMKNMKVSAPSYRLAFIGVMAALCVALSALEGLLPPLPVPGARLGLANVAVTAAMWFTGPVGGLAVGACKVLFVLLSRGATASFMAAGGTLAAVGITALLLPLVRREKLTFVGVCVSAAACHTAGQLCVAAVLLSTAVFSYAPLLLIIGAVSGVLTGLVLNGIIVRLQAVAWNSVKGSGQP